MTTTTSLVEAPAAAERAVGENVNTLLFRAGTNARRLSRELGWSHATLGRKLSGASAWTLREVLTLADYFCVSLEEMTTALPTRDEWEGRWVVRHQGLEPRTRWFEAFGSDQRKLTRGDVELVA